MSPSRRSDPPGTTTPPATHGPATRAPAMARWAMVVAGSLLVVIGVAELAMWAGGADAATWQRPALIAAVTPLWLWCVGPWSRGDAGSASAARPLAIDVLWMWPTVFAYTWLFTQRLDAGTVAAPTAAVAVYAIARQTGRV